MIFSISCVIHEIHFCCLILQVVTFKKTKSTSTQVFSSISSHSTVYASILKTVKNKSSDHKSKPEKEKAHSNLVTCMISQLSANEEKAENI